MWCQGVKTEVSVPQSSTNRGDGEPTLAFIRLTQAAWSVWNVNRWELDVRKDGHGWLEPQPCCRTSTLTSGKSSDVLNFCFLTYKRGDIGVY